MTQVVFAKQQFFVPGDVGRKRLEPFGKQVLEKQFFAQPHRQRQAKRCKTPGRERQIGFHQAFELEERLVVKRHVIDLGGGHAGLLKAIAQGIERKIRIVFFARKALFLRRGDDLAVAHQRGGAVVIERRDADDDHAFKPGTVAIRTACR